MFSRVKFLKNEATMHRVRAQSRVSFLASLPESVRFRYANAITGVRILQRTGLRAALTCSKTPILMPLMLMVAFTPVRSVSSDIQATLRRDFLNNKVILRGFYSGPKLRFDTNGDVLGDTKPGYWSLDGMLKVTKLSIREE